MASRPFRLVAVILVGTWLGTGVAQSEAPPQEAPAGSLRAELDIARRLYSPSRPVWVRFILHNTSDQAIEIPLQTPAEAETGIALPLETVLGSGDRPALTVAYEDEPPVAVQPPAVGEQTEQQAGVLRLAPRGSLGTEFDLRAHYRALRYEGTYRLEWQPLNGRAGTCAVEFQVEPRKDAILVTDKGKVTFSLMYDQAPRNVANFLDLVRQKFYVDKTFHRVIPGFLLQGGCPKGDGTGTRPDGKLIPAEFHDAPFEPGTLAMARKPSDPDSASCQFLITLARLPDLDGQYTIIGQASDEESLRTLNQLASEPTDRRDRPRQPPVIRSINLVDVEQLGTVRLDLTPRSSAAQAPTTPAEPDADRP